MKDCKHCRYSTKMHEEETRRKCRKKKTIVSENDLCTEYKQKKRG